MLGETRPVDQRHRVVRAALVFAKLIDGHDANMVETRGGLRFDLKPGDFLGARPRSTPYHL